MNMIDFTWLHSPGAYEVRITGEKKRARPGPWKSGEPGVPYLSTGTPQWFDLYSPTEIPTLFQKFADTPHSPEGIRDFFNKFGPLELIGDEHQNPSLKPGLAMMSTTVEKPLHLHAAFQRAVTLWNGGDLSALTSIFNEGWGKIRTELRPQQSMKAQIVFVPVNLIQFIWLQFALFATSNSKLLRCARCNEPMIVGSGTGRRETAKFCSNACKMAFHKHAQAGRVK